MQPRIDQLTRTLDAFQIRDTGVKTVPVLPEGDASNSFGNTLTKFLNEASDADAAKSDLTQRFTSGDQSVEMHQVMAASEEASIALDLVVELRNKAVDAYRTIISMQS